MILMMNEQEVIDGICVGVAMRHDDQGDPENVEVVELGQRKNGQFYADVIYHGIFRDKKYELDTDQIISSIANFLMEYHNYNFEELGYDGELLIGGDGTIQARVVFNEQ